MRRRERGEGEEGKREEEEEEIKTIWDVASNQSDG